MDKKNLVLLYSGGLDTSVILKWLVDKDYKVTTVTSDLGQKMNHESVKKKAYALGASDVRIKDNKREFIEDFIFPAIRADARYEGRYLLGTSLARSLTAKTAFEVGKEVGAEVYSHGATGKGNDQVRFELGWLTLDPDCEIFAPWKDPEFLAQFEGRNALIDYAKEKGIPIDQSKKEPWSNDDNFLHISYEAGILENPEAMYFDRMFQMLKVPKDAPDVETLVEIEFKEGNPVRVAKIESFNQNPETGVPEKIIYGREETDSVALFQYLNELAGENGVGILDLVESRYVGMKSRGVYETPAGTVLWDAHKDLEALTVDRDVIRLNQHASIDLAERIYSGFWFSPEREVLQNQIDFSQTNVNGIIRVGLYKGNVIIRGRSSPTSLYEGDVASMDEHGRYDQTKARGFIDITAGRLQANARAGRINMGKMYPEKRG